MRETSVSEALGKKYPEWIVLITSHDGEGRMNIMPAGWAMIASGDPPMFAVAVKNTHTTTAYINATSEFVIAFPSPGMEPAVDFTGSCHGVDVDKFATGCLKTAQGKHVGAPLIEGAIVNMECKLREQVAAGDHTVFIGEVVAAYVEDSVTDRLMNFGPGGYGVAIRK